MSLKFQMMTKDFSIIAADTRVCSTIDGETKIVHDNQHKLIFGSNFVVFFTGILDSISKALNEIFLPINGTINLSNKRITKILKKYHHEIVKNSNIPNNKKTKTIGLSLTRFDDGIMKEFKFLPPEFEPEITTASKESTFSIMGCDEDCTVGGFELTPQEWWKVNSKGEIISDIESFYGYFNSEKYGGCLDIVQIDQFGVRVIVSNKKIPDKRKYTYVNDLQKHNFAIMGGNITWDASSNPVKALYARDNISKPPDYGEDGYISYSSYALSSSNTWHKTLNSSYDYYGSYSYDDGKTWSDILKIRGSDGQNGNDADVPEYIKSTYIDFSQVSSPEIKGNFILGGEVSGGSFWDLNKSSKLMLSNDGKHSDLTYSRADGENLFKIYDGIDGASMYLNSMQIGYVGTDKNTLYPQGKWNFSNATVSGLKITFG